MRAAVAMMVILALTGCVTRQAAPPAVKVPVYLPCQTDVPQRPTFPADALTEADDIWALGTTLWADRKARQAYELGLEIRLQGCVNQPTPPK